MTTMAELGRAAVRAITNATKDGGMRHFVNKTKKYVSIKIETGHLTADQLERVSKELRRLYPTRFLKAYNNTAHPSYWHGAERITVTEEKVNVRFTQG